MVHIAGLLNDLASRLSSALSGRYTIDRELGAGGMATVYLADDLRHHRQVAIKVLREDLAASLGAGRFLREIAIAARLQHPHILPLLDSGDANGLLFFVMPFVAGESLRDRLAREGELPVHDAVRLLIEVVDALAEAHRNAVVHRDIKPDNVMLTGRHALVTDFGVAKAVSEATGGHTVTTLGIAVGTPTYMSPEQASADPHIDHRADIYAVGVMAYELLTGRPPFTGTTPQQVLAAHVTEEPESLARRRPGLSPALVDLVMKCLAKRPADRWQTADELLARLEAVATPSGGITPSHTLPVGAVGGRPRWNPAIVAGAVILLVVLGGAMGLVVSRRATPVMLGNSTQVTSDAGLEVFPTISPDGKFVAYASGASGWRTRILVRPLAGGRTIPLTDDTTAVQTQPRWSPDGSTILFLTGGGVSTAPALGGRAKTLIPMGGASEIRTAAWSPDGRVVVFARGDSLFEFAVASGVVRGVAPGRDLHSCTSSPNGEWLACVSGNWPMVRPTTDFGNIAASTIVVIPSGGGEPHLVTDTTRTNQSPVWSRDGKTLFFVSDRQGPRDIHAQRIGSSGRAVGEAQRLTTGLNVMSIALAVDGTRLAYAVYTAKANIWGMPIPTAPPVSIATATAVTSGSQVIEGIRVSRDGKWMYYDSNLHGNSDVFRIALAGGEPERLTTDPANEFQPTLSPDGGEVAFYTNHGNTRRIRLLSLNGKVVQDPVVTTGNQWGADWAPDGRSLAWYDKDVGRLWVAPRAADGVWQTPVIRAESFWWPRWAADGRTIIGTRPNGPLVEVAAESGTTRVLYTPRPGTTDPVPEIPSWSPDGTGIWFKSHDAAGTGSLWSVMPGGAPRLLVRFDDPGRPSSRPEWATDGKRIYFVINDRQSDIWVVEVKQP